MKIMTEHIDEQVIPAHDVSTELYRFEELDEQIREKMLNDHGQFESECHECEWLATLRELEKLFNVKCDDWNVDAWTHDYTLYAYYSPYTHTRLENADTDDPDYGYLALRGNRAMGKCWTEWGDEVVRGNWHHVGRHSRHSKVVFVGLHDGSCPLTGFCADNDALDPLWDMMQGKHVNDGMTIAEMIDACFESFFTAWEEDMRYRTSEKNFRENEMAEWYDMYGNEVDVPEGAVLTDPPTVAVA